ncbi:Uncharacterised protein [Bordetella pertussis]|nr:Uncharacterised protein [Bordetella pertussis]
MAAATTSASLAKTVIGATGPKVSSRKHAMVSSTPVSTVGA